MKVRASSIANMLADVNLTLNQTAEINMIPGKVSVTIIDDNERLIREYGVDQDA